jgi:hypothetical protein
MWVATRERMVSNMPDSFPPDRMIADLDTLKERTAHILELMEPQEEVDRSYVWQHRECRTDTESGSWSRAGLIS